MYRLFQEVPVSNPAFSESSTNKEAVEQAEQHLKFMQSTGNFIVMKDDKIVEYFHSERSHVVQTGKKAFSGGNK